MGKIPPAFRSAISNSLITAPISRSEPTLQTKFRHFPKKPFKKKDAGVSKRPDDSPENKPPSLFRSPDLSSAKTTFNSLFHSAKSLPDLRFHNSFLQSYAAIAAVHDSVSLLRHMTQTNPSFSPERSTYHILLARSCSMPDSSLSSVHQILNLMVNNGFEPNPVTVDIAARSLCGIGRVDDAVQLVKEFSLKHSPPDNFTFNFLVKTMCKYRDLSSVYDFIDEMKSSFDIKPDLVTYTILIDNVCNTKNLREAMRLVKQLTDSGFKPDCFVYNTIMKGYCMLSRGSEAIEVFNKMKEEGVEPDLVTYNTLIFGLSKAGRVKEARKYLNIMVESGDTPDAATYTSLMNGMCRQSNALGAMMLLGEMERKGCAPNSCTYNTLLHGLCKSRLLAKGIELYKMMKSAGMKLETASYATFVRALCREGRVAEAYEVFDFAVESKSLTDVAAYSTLEGTLKWLRKAREQGLAV